LKSFSHAHAKIIEILLLKSNFFGGGALHHGPKGPCFSALEDKGMLSTSKKPSIMLFRFISKKSI